MNPVLNPWSGTVIFYGELFKGKAVIDVIFKEVMLERFRAPFGGETAPAIVTQILLNASVMTILFGLI